MLAACGRHFGLHGEIPGIIFAADYAAAFDSLNHNFIISAFKLFGFPDYMITWIRILQTGMESSVLNNLYSTGYFHLVVDVGNKTQLLHIYLY